MAAKGRAKERRASLSEEEKQARRIHARRRFKAMIRLVIANRYWLEDDSEEGLSDNVMRNVQLLTRKKEKKSLLTLYEKSILSKPAEDRTDEERAHLNRVIGGLKCFRRYPPHVKSKLAGVTYFFYFPPGRVIIKQHDPPDALYFILYGDVAVTARVWDPVMSEWTTITLGQMVAGQMFGEVSLLHGIYRTATITTLTDCEFLCLKKEDFDVVLKASVMAQWERIQRAMALFEYFQNWDEIASRECCILARMREYVQDETVLGDGIGLTSFTYFIIKGRCQLIEHMYIETIIDKNGKTAYRLWDPEKEKDGRKSTGSIRVAACPSAVAAAEAEMIDSAPNKKNPMKTSTVLPPNVQIHYMQACYLNELATFGIGENFKNRRIVAVTPVQCLLIPRYWLWQRNKDYVWSKVQQYLNNHIPTTEALFKEFVENRKWQEHRKKLVEDVRRNNQKVNYNTIHNVPYSIRITDDLNFKYQEPKKKRSLKVSKSTSLPKIN